MSTNYTHRYKGSGCKVGIDKAQRKILLQGTNAPERVFDFSDILNWSMGSKIGGILADERVNQLFVTVNDLDTPFYIIKMANPMELNVWHARFTAALKGA